ncbi:MULTISPECIES: universal stress protein [unclassified Imperialibacter]|jgi:nucleotide-binding universal stress UspA family protein|uniref:universal stress protein n=1 Tax=unclassified Imperialibacter TaxID=2629706 RepID=UPI001255673D|nr:MULTISPECIES: universal stress protein [unclassified Imperialibacter]CAD5276427.1 Nucleotide-binding universal stress protein, UspA family [Imperialibacter sp. 75]CAD5294469.1 Nucleotide-binding universal stress protein, UspA family [Imperialibacter sp. 89]VVT12502.1 Nucleotide-binding universal stress protein, UspA family [Imperialibacter sp. EC-SDR9]
MHNFHKILVGLDLTDIDEQLIKAASFITTAFKSKEIYFYNVIRDFSVPEELIKEFPTVVEQLIVDRKHEMENKVNQYYSFPDGIKVNFLVKQGQPTKKIMKFADEKKIDLIMVGRKPKPKSGGIIINRLARRAGCSLLIVPKEYDHALEKLFVPIDFSDYSLDAMQQAVAIARSNTKPVKIIAQNVYNVPQGYHYTGKSYKEFAAIMKANAEKNYEKFIKQIDTEGIDIEPIYSLDKHDDVMGTIFAVAKKSLADIIIIGAKGRSATAALFIGTNAEKLVQIDSKIPILVIRPTGRTEGLLEYLKEL